MSVIESFWRNESSPLVRRRLLDVAGCRSSGVTEFNFNVYDVILDFDSETVTVVDVLSGERRSEQTSLAGFLERASAFDDDPAIGDGLTAPHRTPPESEIDREEVAPRAASVTPRRAASARSARSGAGRDDVPARLPNHRIASEAPRASLGFLITTRYLELRLRISGWLCLAGAVFCVILEVRGAVQDIDQPASMLWPAAVLGLVGLVLLRLARWWGTRHPQPPKQR